MLFSSATFLFLFLPVTLLAYYIVPARFRNIILLIASLVFYFFGEPVYVLLLVFSSLSDWLHSLYIEKHRGEPRAKTALISSIIINLAMLAFFKYTDFFIATLNSMFSLRIPLTGIPLPLGISFFTFQTMSYTIDVYRGRVRAQRDLVTLGTFVCLFPQLVAGPIVRYSDIEAELVSRESTLDNIAVGIRRFTVGLGKKLLIANTMGELCATFTASADRSVLFCWLYALGFMLQIYFDFSGYSDMAIGLGKMLGFSFPENFDHPYLSLSVTEFWRRWHMTLGQWFRDYVYIPLGGNRTDKKWKWLRNIAVVWLLTGLWHGAAWNFVLWGGIFGVLLIIEKLWLLKLFERTPNFLRRIYLLLIVMLSFVIFNADNLQDAFQTIAGLFGGGLPAVSVEALYSLRSYAVPLIVAAVGCTELPLRLGKWLNDKKCSVVLEPLAVSALLVVACAYLIDGSFNPFLYFRF